MAFRISGRDTSVTFDILVDGELVVPDQGTVTYTIRNYAGDAVSGHENQPVVTDGSTTTVKIVVPAAVCTKTQDYDSFSVELLYEHDSHPYSQVKSFVIAPWVNFHTTPAEVRALMGSSSIEVPEDDIDLYQAYLDVDDDLGDGVTLLSVLNGGTAKTRSAGQAIALRAALNLVPTLQMRALMILQADTQRAQRFENVDFPALEQSLRTRYANMLSKVAGTTLTTRTFLGLTSPTDALTGS